jgi:hypothetical protein
MPVIPIIGARTSSQLRDHLASFELTLSADELRTFDEASRIELGFLYDFYGSVRLLSTAVCGTKSRMISTSPAGFR